MDGHRPVTPFRLSQRSGYIANWSSIVERLPSGWDEDEFHIVGTPYPWCETLSEDCDCHGVKGRQDVIYCSDFGLHDESDKRANKSQNVRHQNYVRAMEETISRRDESRRQERHGGRQSLPAGPVAGVKGPAQSGGDPKRVADVLADGISAVNRLVSGGFYCSVEGQHHAYGNQPIRKTLANLNGACVQISGLGAAGRQSTIAGIVAHWLQRHQSEECAQRSSWGDVEIPDILYKYIPRELIGQGAPESLRATQLLALNDDMECNVITMKGNNRESTLSFLELVRSRLECHLGIKIQWEELLERSIRFGDLRLSAYVQEYPNPLVGVVSFSTDVLVPTMWAHYARNTGIVVGYDTEALRTLGFELRPVIYSEIAPIYQPERGDAMRLDFVDREDVERELRAGRNRKGLPILASTELARFGAGWRSLARLLLVKGMSWSYEKEVRLLVDLQRTRNTGKTDKMDARELSIRVIDPPPGAIREIYRGPNTRENDLQRAVQAARGDNKKGLFVGHVSSHAFRMQKTEGRGIEEMGYCRWVSLGMRKLICQGRDRYRMDVMLVQKLW